MQEKLLCTIECTLNGINNLNAHCTISFIFYSFIISLSSHLCNLKPLRCSYDLCTDAVGYCSQSSAPASDSVANLATLALD